MENPIECYHDREFLERFRFLRAIVLNTVMPLLFNVEESDDHRRLLISRFFTSGCYKVSIPLTNISKLNTI